MMIETGAFRSVSTEDGRPSRVPLYNPYEGSAGMGSPNQNELMIKVEFDWALEPEVKQFHDRLVQIMIVAPEDGADTATRSYVVIRPFRDRLARGEGAPKVVMTLPMTVAGARALRSELRNFVGKPMIGGGGLHNLYFELDGVLKRKDRQRGRSTPKQVR